MHCGAVLLFETGLGICFIVFCFGLCLQLKSGETINPDLTLKDLKSGQHITRVKIDQLYLLMGRELEALDSVPAGNVLGEYGISPVWRQTPIMELDHIVNTYSQCIVRPHSCAIEPEKNRSELNQKKIQWGLIHLIIFFKKKTKYDEQPQIWTMC